MGLINQAIREIRQFLSNLWGSIPFIKKRRKRRAAEPTEVPACWNEKPRLGKEEIPRKQIVVQKHKLRVPGLLKIKRILAGFLLLLNFIFSQFLLGRVGDQGQPMFIIFLLNSFIMADYLWKTRRAEK